MIYALNNTITFLQVNMCNDLQKNGFSKNEIFIAAKEIAEMKSILLMGIMTIPPNNISAMNLQSIYKETRTIKEAVQKTIEKKCKNLRHDK